MYNGPSATMVECALNWTVQISATFWKFQIREMRVLIRCMELNVLHRFYLVCTIGIHRKILLVASRSTVKSGVSSMVKFHTLAWNVLAFFMHGKNHQNCRDCWYEIWCAPILYIRRALFEWNKCSIQLYIHLIQIYCVCLYPHTKKSREMKVRSWKKQKPKNMPILRGNTTSKAYSLYFLLYMEKEKSYHSF